MRAKYQAILTVVVATGVIFAKLIGSYIQTDTRFESVPNGVYGQSFEARSGHVTLDMGLPCLSRPVFLDRPTKIGCVESIDEQEIKVFISDLLVPSVQRYEINITSGETSKLTFIRSKVATTFVANPSDFRLTQDFRYLNGSLLKLVWSNTDVGANISLFVDNEFTQTAELSLG